MNRLGRGLESLTADRHAAPARPSHGAVAGEGFAGSEAEPSRRIEYVDATPKRPRRPPEVIAAEDEIDAHWVTLLSIERPAPRHFGDNRGMLPIWVEANADWRQSGLVFDRHQPAQAMRAVRLAVLGVRTSAHAARLKAALDEALHGRAASLEADELRHGQRFRNGIDFGDLEVWWTPLLTDALLACELAATDFAVFTRPDHERMVAAKVIEMTRQVEQGRR